jgi:hypothetical protein
MKRFWLCHLERTLLTVRKTDCKTKYKKAGGPGAARLIFLSQVWLLTRMTRGLHLFQDPAQVIGFRSLQWWECYIREKFFFPQ